MKEGKTVQKETTNVSHKQLVEIGAKWLNKKAGNIYTRCQFVVTEFVAQGQNEIADILGLCPAHHVLIEVKVSKSDFKNDTKKIGRSVLLPQIGNFRYFLVPESLITPEELPDKWGLLYYNGKDVFVVKNAEWFESDGKQEGYIYHSILRRLHKPQIFNVK